MIRALKWAALFGATGFLLGFVGPILANPGANQGPLLGIFITGPLGALFGALVGALPLPDRARKAIFVVLTLAGIVALIAFSGKKPRLKGLAYAGEPPRGPLVHGHRGFRAQRPENTLAAFAEALRVGTDVLELDMQETQDGVVVVSHDAFVLPERCLKDGKPAVLTPIRALTLAQLKEYDCGSLKNPLFPEQRPVPGERVPTLEEVFELVERSTQPAAKAAQFNIETKLVPSRPELSPEPDGFARDVVALVRKHRLVRRVILQSFDDRTLRAAKRLEPSLRVSMLTSDNHVDYAAVAKAVGADIISPDADWIAKEDVDALHAIGVQVAPWTVNDEKGWARLIGLGVDAIITDRPAALIEYLKKRGLR